MIGPGTDPDLTGAVSARDTSVIAGRFLFTGRQHFLLDNKAASVALSDVTLLLH